MATETIYDQLTKAVDITPNKGEEPQAFYERLFRAVNALEDSEFDALPEAAQHWSNDASEALTNKQPIQMLPGSPFEPEGGEAEEDPNPPKRAAKDEKKTSAKASAKATGRGKAPAAGKGKAAAIEPTGKAPAKAKAAPKEKHPKTPREKKVGVLDHLMAAVYEHPDHTPQQLKEVVEKEHGIEVKIANAIGIRQQYRRIVGFIQSKGHATDLTIR